MAKDLGMQWQSECIKTSEMIKKIQKIGIMIPMIVESFDRIQMETKEEIQLVSAEYASLLATTFKEERLTSIYSKSIKSIKEIQMHLKSRYEEYFDISEKCKSIENYIKDFKPKELDTYILIGIHMLESLEGSSTLDCVEKEELIQRAYKCIYNLVKLEALFSTKSELLTFILSSDIHATYIERLVEESIENYKISTHTLKTEQEDGLGFDMSHLNEIILSTLAIKSDENEKYFMEQERKIYCSAKMIHRDYSFLIKEKKKTEESLENNKDRLRKTKWQKKGVRLFYPVLLGASIGLSISGYHLIKKISTTPAYLVKEVHYDFVTGKEKEEPDTYKKKIEPFATITEKGPWVYSAFEPHYKRTITTYHFDESPYTDPKEFVGKNLKKLGADIEEKYQTKTTLQEEDMYEETQTTLHMKWQDLEKSIQVPYYQTMAFFTTIAIFLLAAVDFLLLYKIHKTVKSKKEDIIFLREKIEKEKSILEDSIKELQDKNLIFAPAYTLLQNLYMKLEKMPFLVEEDEKEKVKELYLSMSSTFKEDKS